MDKLFIAAGAVLRSFSAQRLQNLQSVVMRSFRACHNGKLSTVPQSAAAVAWQARLQQGMAGLLKHAT